MPNRKPKSACSFNAILHRKTAPTKTKRRLKGDTMLIILNSQKLQPFSPDQGMATVNNINFDRNNNVNVVDIVTPDCIEIDPPAIVRNPFVPSKWLIREVSYQLDIGTTCDYDADSDDEEFLKQNNDLSLTMEQFEAITDRLNQTKPKTIDKAVVQIGHFDRRVLQKVFTHWELKWKTKPSFRKAKDYKAFFPRMPKTPSKGTRGEMRQEEKAKYFLYKQALATRRYMATLIESYGSLLQQWRTTRMKAERSFAQFERQTQSKTAISCTETTSRRICIAFIFILSVMWVSTDEGEHFPRFLGYCPTPDRDDLDHLRLSDDDDDDQHEHDEMDLEVALK
jgi:hypothetical protein